jgi:ABC-type Mn2+/Zn2+ transport system ATPase subunit
LPTWRLNWNCFALVDRDKSFKKLGLEKELAQVRIRETERAYAVDGETVIEAIEEATEQFETSIADIDLPEVPPETSAAHASVLNELTSAVRQAKEAALKAAKQATKEIANAKERFLLAQGKLTESFTADELVFNKQLNKLPAMKGKSAAQLAADYKKVSVQIAQLKPLGVQKATHEAKLLELNKVRQTLLAALSKIRSAQWSKLSKAIKELNKRLESQLRVDFEPEKIREPLKLFLMNCQLEGIGEKRLTWIDEAENISIADFVATIRQGTEEIQNRFKDARISRQAAEAIAGLPGAKVRELEEIDLPERLELLLNVSRDGENYREVSRLSTGQQCTAILHLLLLDNQDPLVIDQPEDNLDNAFIADHIVDELRASKTSRQFVFATHNANIPVFGDAEWIGVLREEDGHCKLQASGSIDAPNIKELAANILEGGREAFNRRREKYGL